MNIDEFKDKYFYNQSTPVMQQYLDVKFTNIDSLVLFRLGDFYELFFDDAVNASKVLGITLTKRGKSGDIEIPMCGIPYHALENYLPKLIEDGYKVAICDQTETPEEAKIRAGYKAVVNREVARIITPGTIIEDNLINASTPNYLVSCVFDQDLASICYADLSTAEIGVMEIPKNDIISILSAINPKEILLSEKIRTDELIGSIVQNGYRVTYQVDSFFAHNKCEKIMQNFYGIASIESIGSVSNLQVRSIGSVLEYISLTQKQNLPIFELPKIINTKSTMHIDASARRNLEIVTNLSGHKRGSLLDVIDHTTTKPGSRLLHKFLSSPLADMRLINSRLEITEFFYKSEGLTEELRKLLRSSGDLEKCLSRVSMNRSSPRDLLTIQTTLEIALEIKGIFLQHFGLQVPVYIEPLVTPLSGDEELSGVIKSAIKEDAPANLMDGEIIKPEYHPKVAELDHLIKDSRSIIDKLKERYKNETGIDGLKISHNNVIGLFIEVTAKNSSKIIDPQFIHRQTTVNAARYTTLELQKLESEMVNAKSLKVSLEKELYQEICELVIKKLPNLKALSNALALIDVFTNFAYIALEYGYTKPLLTEGEDLVIESGRHPVVERSLKIKAESSFVSNNSSLSCEKRVWLITGPNMSGKSTFLRQNALISILAQIGSFVPAKYAKIGVIDKIFSRIGAGDDLLKNQSTFMVEMIETSAILAQATAKSLIILDEIGRGTSTYDGVAIAWSVLEHIHDKIRSRCLFATHYHELTNMADFLPALDNYTVAIDEKDGEILFLHRIIKGAADKSYGIHVAELAGLPGSVISRANELLAKLEKGSEKKNKAIMKNESHNLSLF